MGNSQSVTVKVPGTCGELIQGSLNGKNRLVTCPVKIFSYVTVSFVNHSYQLQHSNLKNSWKAKEALKKVLQHFNLEDLFNKLQFDIHSEIPIAKGMASSTADIVGICLATAKLLTKSISEKTVADIAISIEPSDGTMFNGIAIFDYFRASMFKILGNPPKMKILVIDTGGEIDTIEFNKKDYKKERLSNEAKVKEAIELLKDGLRKNDLNLVGKAATISAICNQKILFKPELERVIETGREFNAYGVNVAHSGTVIGILLNTEFNEFDTLKEEINQAFNKKFKFYITELTNGGGCNESSA
ncbi:MAG: GHMP kinase [Elusimicrobiota bacterium]